MVLGGKGIAKHSKKHKVLLDWGRLGGSLL